MKKSILKRAGSAVLALATVFTALFSNVVTTKAATTETVALFTEGGAATVGVETEQYSFSLDDDASVDFGIIVPAAVDVTFNVYKDGSLYESYDIAQTNSRWYYFAEYGMFDNGVLYDLTAGDYSVSYTFGASTEYIAYADAEYAKATISQEKATITVGYTKKLSVSNGNVTKWSSKNSKIAKVDKNGKVTAKKKGTTTIVATLDNGDKLLCKVTVKDNKYTETKLTTSDISYGNWDMQVYGASFDKSGNLVLKVNIVNSMSYKIVRLDNVKITLKDGNGKTIGTYKASKKNITVPAHSTKTTTITIKKSSLKKKKADLRQATVSIPTSVSARYYY